MGIAPPRLFWGPSDEMIKHVILLIGIIGVNFIKEKNVMHVMKHDYYIYGALYFYQILDMTFSGK